MKRMNGARLGWCMAAGILAVASAGCGKPNPGAGSDSKSQSELGSRTGSNAGEQPFEITTKSGVKMVWIPGGEFTMGDNQGNSDEGPAHLVRVSAFLMDTYEVTQELLAQVQLPNPSRWNGLPGRPVERVRWRDAKQYCNERSLLEGLKPCYNEKTPDWDCDFTADGYRLPTEAEWEYACRAGSGSRYDFGQPEKLKQYAWFDANGDQKTHAVGLKRPNAWGLHDLYGNVSEWCEDVYSPTFYGVSPSVDPTGPKSPGKDVQRVTRGGSWKSSAEMCRATFRQGQHTGDTDACFYTDYCGFRAVRRVSPEALAQLERGVK